MKRPLYKVLLRLKCNPQSKEKIFTMSKQKWKKLIKSLLVSKKLAKLLYDQFLYYKFPKSNVTKSQSGYRNKLVAKQRFKLLFGGLTNKYFNKLRASSESSACYNNSTLPVSIFHLLEQRLDNILYRLGFVPSLRVSRKLISQSMIIINGSKVDQPFHKVKPGDFVTVNRIIRHLIATNTSLSVLNKIFYKHLHVNYRTLNFQIGCVNSPTSNQYNYFLGLRSPLKM